MKSNRRAHSATDRVVRLVDQTSIAALSLALVSVILVSATVFYFLAKDGGVVPTFVSSSTDAFSFVDAIYFSITTVSSLGYGDYRPIGVARAFAGVEVFLGLAITSLFIGKLASERQGTITKLLYTSDHERRLQVFVGDLDRYIRVLRVALNNHDDRRLATAARRFHKLLQSLKVYVVFQTEVGMFGQANKGVFRKVLRRVADLSLFVDQAASQPGLKRTTQRLLEKSLRSASQLGRAVEQLSTDDVAKSTCRALQARYDAYRARQRRAKQEGRPLTDSAVAEVTPRLLRHVREIVPEPPWQRDLNKKVARELGISNKLAQKCLDDLVAEQSRLA